MAARAKLETYRDRKGEWRWRLTRKVAGRVKIVAEGGEGYQRRGAMLRTLRNLGKALEQAQA